MSAPGQTHEFPREAYLELLQNALHLFQDRNGRRELLGVAGLIEAAAAPRKEQSRRELLAVAGVAEAASARREDESRRKLVDRSVLLEAAAARREDESRREASSGAGLVPAPEHGERQPVLTGGESADRATEAPAPRRQPRYSGAAETSFAEEPGDTLEDLPAAPFASALLEKLSPPERAGGALQLARRISAVLPHYDAHTLLRTLERLYLLRRKQVLESGASPALETYREWAGFEVVHQYSLGDRFFGREQELQELDEWLSSGGAAISVRCLCALGGGGKSALAWHWITRALPTLHERGYRGAFWCSFYEKDFDFEAFLRRALVFAGNLDEGLVKQLSRPEVESRLLTVLHEEPFVIIMDGLERLMNGYAVIFDRAIDPDSIRGGKHEEEVTLHDRRQTDPRNSAFLRALAGDLESRVLITTRLAPTELQDSSSAREIPRVCFMQLGGLTADEATALWTSILPDSELHPEIRYIFTVSGNHPLVVSILARSVANAGGRWEQWLKRETYKDFGVRREASEAEVRAYVIGTCMRGLGEKSYDVLGVLTTSGRPMTLDVLTGVLQQGSAAAGDDRWASPQDVIAELEQLVSLGFVGVAEPAGVKEYDVHPVVRGQVWALITDPRRERSLSHALSEYLATPDRDTTGIDLNRPTALFQLLVQSGEIDRAWEMYLNKLWWPLTRQNDYRTLLSLVSLLLPEGDALQLVPLRSRREQGSAAEVLASLLMSAGDGTRSDKLFRWCGAIRLQTGDFIGFLNARHMRCWQTMYEGRLFQTELDLKAMKRDALHFGATEIEPEIDCWIGILLALRGREPDARHLFMKSQHQTSSYRWWAQALAEGHVYLNEPDEALQWLEKASDTPLTPTDGKLQEAWERLSRGMAMFQKNDDDHALGELSSALEISLRANYAIIQCFAIPYIAEIFLRRDQVDEAETHLREYTRLDPDNQYQLSASEAWRVRALCSRKRGNDAAAREEASKAYRLAACDGPPFVYEDGLRRALETLRECGAYVPRAESRLDPDWSKLLGMLESEPLPVYDIDGNGNGMEAAGPAAITREQAFELLEQTTVMRQASAKDREWWDAITKEISSTIERPFAEAMEQSGITLEDFRKEYEVSAHKSVLVVFHKLLAESIVRPEKPRPVRDLDEASLRAWLGNTAEHQESLTQFLATEFATRIAYPFLIHDLDRDTTGIRAFLGDNKRRIDYAGASEAARTWWDHLELARKALEMLILSECIYVNGTPLDEFVQEIATGTARGIEYAFAAIGVKRAIEDLEVKAISRTEGWSDVQILLRLQDVKHKLAWQRASSEARDFWASVEKKNSQQVARVLQIAEELAVRGATVEDYYQAWLFSNTDDVQANLSYIDYTRLKRQVWDGQPSSWQRAGRPLDSEASSAAFSDTSQWTEDQIRKRLGYLQTRIQHGAASDGAKQWWTTLEAQHPPSVLVRVAEELDSRSATLQELFTAKAEAATENVPAAVAYLSFTRIGKSAVQRANDLNDAGNTHFHEKRFAEAIQSYERTIRLRPDYYLFYTNLAQAWERRPDLTRLDALQHAIQVLERGLKYCPQSDEILSQLKAAQERKALVEAGHANAPSLRYSLVPTSLSMEVGATLIPLLSDLKSLIPPLRERIRVKTGIDAPDTLFRGNEDDFPQTSYLIMITEVPYVMGDAFPDRRFTAQALSTLKEQGIASATSAFNPLVGSDGCWISVEEAQRLGDETLDASHYLIAHLENVIIRHLPVFVTHQSMAVRLEEEGGADGAVIANDTALLGRFVRLIRALVEESAPTVALSPICSTFLEKARQGADLDETLMAVRLLPEIRAALPGRTDEHILALGEDIETEILHGLYVHGDEHVLALEPEMTQEILSAVRTTVGSIANQAVVIVNESAARRYVRKLVELEFPSLSVISRAELDSQDGRPVTDVIKLVD